MMPMRPTLLTTEKLTLRAGTVSLPVQFDWQVSPGEFWCVLGKNGIGKSTLLHTVSGLLPPAGGQVYSDQGNIFQSQSPRQLALWRGLVSQEQFDAFSIRVRDSVMSGLHPHRTGWGWPDEQDRRAALVALRRLGMASHADTDVMRLSGGERQRVAIATLLLQAPRLYLFDEPVSHQDVAAQQKVMLVLRDLADDSHAVIASMHDINLAARFATHILLIGAHRCWQGTTRDVLRPDLLQMAFDCPFEMLESTRGRWLMPVSMTV
jgi:iron complex transport system ATP-binding protein